MVLAFSSKRLPETDYRLRPGNQHDLGGPDAYATGPHLRASPPPEIRYRTNPQDDRALTSQSTSSSTASPDLSQLVQQGPPPGLSDVRDISTKISNQEQGRTIPVYQATREYHQPSPTASSNIGRRRRWGSVRMPKRCPAPDLMEIGSVAKLFGGMKLDKTAGSQQDKLETTDKTHFAGMNHATPQIVTRKPERCEGAGYERDPRELMHDGRMLEERILTKRKYMRTNPDWIETRSSMEMLQAVDQRLREHGGQPTDLDRFEKCPRIQQIHGHGAPVDYHPSDDPRLLAEQRLTYEAGYAGRQLNYQGH